MLAYWPGISAYDIYTQIFEVFEDDYTNRNPLLHTLILGAFYRLGEGLGRRSAGLCAVHSDADGGHGGGVWRGDGLSVAHRRTRAFFWTALVLFALFPVHAMLAISDTKDGFFVALLVLVVIRFHRLLEDPSLMRRPGFVAGFAALGALMCMMRNNAFAGILVHSWRDWSRLAREGRLRLCALMLGTLVLYQGALNG